MPANPSLLKMRFFWNLLVFSAAGLLWTHHHHRLASLVVGDYLFLLVGFGAFRLFSFPREWGAWMEAFIYADLLLLFWFAPAGVFAFAGVPLIYGIIFRVLGGNRYFDRQGVAPYVFDDQETDDISASRSSWCWEDEESEWPNTADMMRASEPLFESSHFGGNDSSWEWANNTGVFLDDHFAGDLASGSDINPASGLIMVGDLDTAGNPYGCNFDH